MKEIKQFKKDLEKVTLSEKERTDMRNVVFSHVAENPVPVHSQVNDTSHFQLLQWFFTHRTLVASIATFVLVIGFTSAAERALPGDLLYSVKVNFTEPVVKGLAFTDEAKARAYADIAERRLVEIERVSLYDDVNEEVINELSQDFKEHAEVVNDYTNKIKSSGNRRMARKVNADFKATLDAHAKILKVVSNEEDESDMDNAITTTATSTATSTTPTSVLFENETENATSSDPLFSTSTATTTLSSNLASTTAETVDDTSALGSVSSVIDDVVYYGNKAAETENKIDALVASSKDEAGLVEAVKQSQKDAEESIDKLYEYIENLGDEKTKVKFNDEFENIEKAADKLEEGIKMLEDGSVHEASELINEALEEADEAFIVIKAQKELQIDVDSDGLEENEEEKE